MINFQYVIATELFRGVLGTSAIIDETANAFEELVDEIIRAAEIETTMKCLLTEIESMKRRVNALLEITMSYYRKSLRKSV